MPLLHVGLAVVVGSAVLSTPRPARAAYGEGGRRGGASRSAEPLGKYANNSSPAGLTPVERRERRNEKRRGRYALRFRLRGITKLKRVKDCGHVSITSRHGADGQVLGDRSGPVLRVTEMKSGRVAGLSGLAHCGSVWACPACSATIATRRAEELADVMRWALEQGCSASMVTLTMRHHPGQSLKQCWDAVSYAWGRVTSGKQWVNDRATAGLQGWAKAIEVTHGKNGWHVHVHILMIWRGNIGEDTATAVGERMWSRWARALRRKGFDSLRKDVHGHDVGLDVRLASLDPGKDGRGLHQYFVKLSHEITGGQHKLARGEGRTPFQLLKDGLDTGLADDIERWWEWEQSSRGRRQISWSKGLREWAKLAPEQTDEEIVEEELQGDDVLLIEPESWRVLRERPERVCALLEAAEAGGFRPAAALLDSWGLRWLPGKARPPSMSRLMLDTYRAFPLHAG